MVVVRLVRVRRVRVRLQEGAAPVRVTSKGQVTIPAEIRERMGLLPHTEVEFTVTTDEIMALTRGE